MVAIGNTISPVFHMHQVAMVMGSTASVTVSVYKWCHIFPYFSLETLSPTTSFAETKRCLTERGFRVVSAPPWQSGEMSSVLNLGPRPPALTHPILFSSSKQISESCSKWGGDHFVAHRLQPSDRGQIDSEIMDLSIYRPRISKLLRFSIMRTIFLCWHYFCFTFVLLFSIIIFLILLLIIITEVTNINPI